MPITNNNSNGSSPRGRGRPALGNIDRLFARFCDAYRDGQGLSLSTIASEFGWTEGTARAMVSQVRTTHRATIYYRRRSSRFFLQSMPANAPTLRTAAEIPVAAPVAAPARPTLADVLRERLDAPVTTTPTEDTIETIAECLHDAYPSYGVSDFRAWLRERTVGSLLSAPLEAFLANSRYNSVRGRVFAWMRAERARNAPTPVVAPVAAPDSLWRGIDPAVAAFYRERALDLRQ